MSEPETAAAPDSGISQVPTFDELLLDPEIAALLDFEPAPRKMPRPDGWTPELQRELIARIANCGSPGVAAEQMGKNATGAKHLYRAEGADSFQAAWKAAIALARARERERRAARRLPPVEVPGMARRSRTGEAQPLLPGQVYNENGLPEDAESFNRRGEEAGESIANKLLRCRRSLLCEISRDPGKRAAFELLTELPIDWDKARRLEEQPDEPWRVPNMREPDMVLTAETGWFGTIVPDYGPDKIGPLREAINKARKKRGLVPIEQWSEDRDERAATPSDDADSVLHDWAARNAEAEVPAEEAAPTGPPPSRSFGLNSQEFYDVVAKPGRRARIEPRE